MRARDHQVPIGGRDGHGRTGAPAEAEADAGEDASGGGRGGRDERTDGAGVFEERPPTFPSNKTSWRSRSLQFGLEKSKVAY